MNNSHSLEHGHRSTSFQHKLQSWFPGLLARITFASVLFFYFYNSAKTKVGEGLEGFLQIQDGAFFQIMPSVVERFNYDASQVPFFPYQLIVYVATYAEFILPVLIIIGLFTRIAALGMLIFISVQSYVDITAHAVDKETIGSFFDRIPDAAIVDQRLLWAFLFIYLIVYGAGKLSIDHLFFGRRFNR